MPQLMPFMWVNSIFMSFFVFLSLVVLYDFISGFGCLKLNGFIKNGMYKIKW